MIDQSASVWLPSPGFEGGTVRFRAVSERPAKPYAISREKVGLNPKSKMMCRLAIAENSSHTEISASDRLARASGRTTANPHSLAVSASQVMTVAERQALMHSLRALSRRNPNAVQWRRAFAWVVLVVPRLRALLAVCV